MAALISVNSVGVAFAKSSQDADEPNTSSSQSVAKESTKKKLIFGGAVLSAAVLGKFVADYFKSYDYVVGKYLASDANESEQQAFTKVSPDQWFARLGGTQQDIDQYCRIVRSGAYINCGAKNVIRTIEVDVLREVPNSCRFGNRNENEAMMKRILKVSEYNGNASYLQGYSRYCALVMNKFLKYDTQPYSLEKEAKIYYVYRTIVSTTSDYAEQMLDPNTQFAFNLTKKVFNSGYLKKHPQIPGVLDNPDVASFAMLKSYITSGMDVFTMRQSINIWDDIILDRSIVNYGNFDSSKAQLRIATILNAVSLKAYNNGDVNSEINPECYSELCEAMHHYCESLEN